MKVFLDADVLFSASYSMNGASHEVVNHSSVILYTSNECMNEAIRALKKYDKSLDPIFFEKIKIVNVTKKDALEYDIYVFDLSDAHRVWAKSTIGLHIQARDHRWGPPIDPRS